jgi:4-amino-4-deoxy-L-arabinose transferase-like glycosyltransferase
MLAAALAVVTPITIWEATTAYVDLALAFYVSLSMYALARYDSSRDRRWLVLSALLMSAALAVKHLGLVALAIVTGVLGAREIHRSRRIRQALGVTALFVGISLTLPLPWYARAYLASGNPVFPDMYRVFGATPAERWSPDNERGLQNFKDRFGTTRTPGNLARLPWNATVHAASFGGTLGPLFLILVPGALIGRGVRRTALLLAAGCAAYIAIWASPISSFQMRFLIPIVPLLAVLGAEGAARVHRAAQAVGPVVPNLVLSALVVLLLFNLPPTSEWHEPDRQGWSGWMTHIVRGVPAAVVVGSESKQEYLTRTVPSYAAWHYINSTLPAAVRILTFHSGDHLYSLRPRLPDTAPAANTATWSSPAWEECTALAAMRALGVTHVLFDKRQLDDGSVRALAIGSDAMLACCLLLEW